MKKMYFMLCLALGLSGVIHAQNDQRRITTWNGSQWSDGIPDKGSNAVIAADLSTSENLQAYNLTVAENVKLTMTGNSKLTLVNDFIARQGAKITLAEDSEFIQKNPFALTPSMDYYRRTGYILKYDYTYFSSPVSGQVINQLTAYSLPNDLSFNVGTYQNPNGPLGTYLTPRPDKYWTWNEAATPVGTDNNLLITGAWQNIDSTTVMNPNAKGYIVRAPDSFPDGPSTGTSQQWWVKFSGVPNAGVITRNVAGSAYPPLQGNNTPVPSPVTVPYEPCNNPKYKMNLIGNPYTSALDADTFLTNPNNVSVIDGAIYLWSHNSGPSAANPGNGSQVHNYTSNDYLPYNLIGGVGTGRITGDPVHAPDDSNRPIGKVAMCQGFFVRGISNGTVTFNPDMQDTGITTDNQQFYRGTGTQMIPSVAKNRFWVSLEGGGQYRELLLGYMGARTIAAMPYTTAYTIPGSVNGYDKRYDTELYTTIYNRASDVTGRVEFYSITDTLNRCPRLAIQGRMLNNPFNVEDVVPLGFSCPAGTYTIKAEKFEGIFATRNFWLREEILAGAGFLYHDIKNTPFTFSTSGEADNTTRFQIVFKLPGMANLGPSYCDTTLAGFNTLFSASGAASQAGMGYNWLFVDADDNEIFPAINTSNSNFSLVNSNIPLGFIDFGMTYYIKVGVWNISLNNWVYSTNTCSVTTPQRTITAAGNPCGSNILINQQVTASDNAPFGYRWLVSDTVTTLTFDTTSRSFLFRADSSGPAVFGANPGFIHAGGTYCFQVAALYSTSPSLIVGNYSPQCCFTMPSPRPGQADWQDENEEFKFTAVPNPFNDHFIVTGNSQDISAVEVLLYDMIGRIVEQVVLPAREISGHSLGQGLPTGVYTVTIKHREKTEVVKIIKR